MSKNLAIFLLVFLLARFIPSETFYIFVPNGKEILYEYRAFVKAGALLPRSYASECFVRGTLHMQWDTDNSITVFLSVIKFRLFNGHRSYKHELAIEDVLASEEVVKNLTTPFKIVYQKSGLVEKIFTQTTDNNTNNFYKGIASILQIKLDRVDLNEDKRYGFSTEEDSVHGKMEIIYNVGLDGTKVIVKKMQTRTNTNFLYQNIQSNVRYKMCQTKFEEPISSNSHQTYVIDKNNGGYLVNKIESGGGIYIYPFLFKSQGQYIYTYITLKLKNHIHIRNKSMVAFTHIINNLQFDIFDVNKNSYQFEGPSKFEALERMLSKILEDSNIDSSIVSAKTEVLDQLVDLLTSLDYDTLKQFYYNLEGYLQIVFFEVIPVVGTQASLRLIKHNIIQREVENDIAIETLIRLPFYIKKSTIDYLRDFEDIIVWSNTISVKVRNTALLSFGRLIYKTYLHQPTIASKQECIEASKKYLDSFAEKIELSQDIAVQTLYIQCLLNTKLPTVINYLLPIFTNTSDYKIRSLVLWGLTTLDVNSDQIYEFIWPIFTNQNENSNIRQIAYYIIMKSSPSTARFLDVFWATQGQLHTELYHFHYTFLKSISVSNNPCLETLKRYAMQHFKFTVSPEYRRLSTFYQIDFLDTAYNVGKDFTFMSISSEFSLILYFETNFYIFNMYSNNYKVFVQIDGLSKLTKSCNNLKQLWSYLSSYPDLENVTIQIMIGLNDEIIQIYSYRGNHLKEMTLFNLLKQTKSLLKIDYQILVKMLIPTELGVPAVLDISMPKLSNNQFNANLQMSHSNIQLFLNSTYFIKGNLKYGVSVYNPFANLWHGTYRYHSYYFHLPLYTYLEINKMERSLNISLRKSDKELDSNIILQTHVQTLLFIKGDITSLNKSCSNCQNWIMATRGDSYRRNYTLFQIEDTTLGYDFEVNVFDSDILITKPKVKKVINMLTSTDFKNFYSPIDYLFLTFYHSQTLLTLQPEPSTHGFQIRLGPKQECLQSFNRLDIVFNLNQIKIYSNDTYFPKMYLGFYGKLALNSKEVMLKFWDVNTTISLNQGHTNRIIEMFVRSGCSNNSTTSRIYFKNEKLWTFDGVYDTLTIGTDTNKSFIDATMVGKQHEEQKSSYYIYDICQPYAKEEEDFYSYNCLLEHSSIKDYRYNVKTINLSSKNRNILLNTLKYLQLRYDPLYNFESTFLKSETSINILLNDSSLIDITVPKNVITQWLFYPDNTHYSLLYSSIYNLGLASICIVKTNSTIYKFNQFTYTVNYNLSNAWMPYLSRLSGNVNNVIFLKKNTNKNNLALKATNGDRFLEIHLNDRGEFRVVVNKLQILVDYYKEDWFVLMKVYNGIALTVLELQAHIMFNERRVLIAHPGIGIVNITGHCANIIESTKKVG